MKRLNLVYIMIFSIGLLYSCNNRTDLQETDMHKVTFKVSTGKAGTKVSYDMNRAANQKLIWDAGDIIGVFQRNPQPGNPGNWYCSDAPFYLSTRSNNNTMAEFVGQMTDIIATDYLAYYPYSGGGYGGGWDDSGNDSFELPFDISNQHYVENGFTRLPAIAVLEGAQLDDATIEFVTICNVLKLQLLMDSSWEFGPVEISNVEISYFVGPDEYLGTAVAIPEEIFISASNLSDWSNTYTISYPSYWSSLNYSINYHFNEGVLIPEIGNNPLILHIGIPAGYDQPGLFGKVSIYTSNGAHFEYFNHSVVDGTINTIFSSPIIYLTPAYQ